jgi:HlyD family secretion protein
MNIYSKMMITALLILSQASCNGHEKMKPHASNKYKIKLHPLHSTLHFTGTIKPVRESPLISPIDAIIESMNVHYGQMIKKEEVVLTLKSKELQKQYNDTLTDYLKAKDSYSITTAKFVGTQDLWNSGLLSKNNFLTEKSSVNTERVSLMQATRKLTELLKQIDENNSQNLSTLNLANFDEVKKILTSEHDLMTLKAPSDGVILYPSTKSAEDKTGKITVGSSVKSGQIIALIGDLKGVSVEIDVPEIDIDKIHLGMSAKISGVAFGKMQLKGKLISINTQASDTSAGGLPSFTGVVEVSSLTAEQQAWVKVGMSAVIELNAESTNQLLIPIAAVKREKQSLVVNLQLPRGGVEKRIITTGTAQAESIVVESGLKEGDVVIYD